MTQAGPETVPSSRIGWVVYSPDTDDYLGQIADAGELYGLGWCATPELALQWPSISEAERVAHERVEHQSEPGNRQYDVEVCELLSAGSQLLTRLALQIVPHSARTLTAGELQGLRFSPDFAGTAARLGIRISHVRSVISRPSRITHHVESGASLFIHEVRGVHPRRHLLAILDATDPRQPVLAAWPIPLSVAGPDPTPIAALHALCEAAGGELTFQGRRTRLVFGERHPEVPRSLFDVVGRVPAAGEEGVFQIRAAGDRTTGELRIGWAYDLVTERLEALLRA